MPVIARTARHPIAFVVEQRQQQARVDRVFGGNAFDGLRAGRPPGGAEIFPVLRKFSARLRNIGANIEIRRADRENDLAIRHDLDVRTGIGRRIRDDQQGAGIDQLRWWERHSGSDLARLHPEACRHCG